MEDRDIFLLFDKCIYTEMRYNISLIKYMLVVPSVSLWDTHNTGA